MAAILNDKAQARYKKAKEAADRHPVVQGLRKMPGYNNLVSANLDEKPPKQNRSGDASDD